jgi:hypothetical protein
MNYKVKSVIELIGIIGSLWVGYEVVKYMILYF